MLLAKIYRNKKVKTKKQRGIKTLKNFIPLLQHSGTLIIFQQNIYKTKELS